MASDARNISRGSFLVRARSETCRSDGRLHRALAPLPFDPLPFDFVPSLIRVTKYLYPRDFPGLPREFSSSPGVLSRASVRPTRFRDAVVLEPTPRYPRRDRSASSRFPDVDRSSVHTTLLLPRIIDKISSNAACTHVRAPASGRSVSPNARTDRLDLKAGKSAAVQIALVFRVHRLSPRARSFLGLCLSRAVNVLDPCWIRA